MIARRATLIVWALMAAVNLSAGVAIATWPERQADLETMREWGRNWLVAGSNIYVSYGNAPDYPPNAIVALSPLGVLPDQWAVPVWAGLNLALAILATYLAVRVARPQTALFEAGLPMLMFLCWGGFRALLQFSLLSLTFGLLAMVVAEKRPKWSGVCLGLALMKPQMAAPFFLWALFTRRVRIAGIAVLVACAGVVLFCLRVHASPLAVALQYAAILKTLYTGNVVMIGLSQLRPLIARAVSNAAIVDAIAGTITLSMLAVICRLGFAEGKQGKTLMYSAPLVGVWSLLTFYHLTYGFLLLLPAATLLLFANDPDTAKSRARLFWVMQLGLMVDVPNMWRRFGHLFHAPRLVSDVLMQADRVLMLAIFLCLTFLAMKVRQTFEARPAAFWQ